MRQGAFTDFRLAEYRSCGTADVAHPQSFLVGRSSSVLRFQNALKRRALIESRVTHR